MIVIDASAVLELLLRTKLGVAVEARALTAEEHLHSPHLLDAEVTQALRRLVLLKEATVVRAQEALQDYAALLIERAAHGELLQRVWELRNSITAYDGMYVALAEALDAPLLTCDKKLGGSHGHRAKIEVIA